MTEKNNKLSINETLVRDLIAVQFPQWQHLSIQQILPGGWDNRTFRLGEEMLVRMPSEADYALQVEKEQKWLPQLAPFLPLQIPVPIAMGLPNNIYPWKWSIYRWLAGESAASSSKVNLNEIAVNLAEFLIALQKIKSVNGPEPGEHSFFRGGSLSVYDSETRKAIMILKNQIDVNAATLIWETALATYWQGLPVWVHGDISPGNLLLQNGSLIGVIDFGQLSVGDPACDLAIAWSWFENESRKIFRANLSLDADTWLRARAWALWKALIVCADFSGTNPLDKQNNWRVLSEVLADSSI